MWILSSVIVIVWSIPGQLPHSSSHADGEAEAPLPCLALVYTDGVESICLLVCQTLLPGVLRGVTERRRRMEAGLAE